MVRSDVPAGAWHRWLFVANPTRNEELEQRQGVQRKPLSACPDWSADAEGMERNGDGGG